MKIIILGCGKVGRKLAAKLTEEQVHDITVIDLRYNIVEELINNYDIMGIVGNGIDKDTLLEAGVKEADLLIAVSGSDEINLLACLFAKNLGRCATIARVRKPEYAKSVQMLKNDLNLAMFINPSRAAASEIARILRFPSAIQIDTFARGRVEILKFKVDGDNELCDMRVADIVAKLKCDVLVCGVERGDEVHIPRGDFILRNGDLVSIVSSVKNANAFFKRINIRTNRVKDTIIVGGGDIAYYLAHQLSELGVSVKIIEQSSERCEELCRLLPGVSIINGDGTDNRLLLEEGLEHAESLVSLINIDEENILLSLFARTKTNGKIVTKINRIAYDGVVDKLDLGSVIYPKNITTEYIIRLVRAQNNSIGSNIETVHFIFDEKAEALEFFIKDDSPVVDVSIDKLPLKDNILIACIQRGNKVIIPRGSDEIKRGDSVIIVTLKSGFKDITDILR